MVEQAELRCRELREEKLTLEASIRRLAADYDAQQTKLEEEAAGRALALQRHHALLKTLDEDRSEELQAKSSTASTTMSVRAGAIQAGLSPGDCGK